MVSMSEGRIYGNYDTSTRDGRQNRNNRSNKHLKRRDFLLQPVVMNGSESWTVRKQEKCWLKQCGHGEECCKFRGLHERPMHLCWSKYVLKPGLYFERKSTPYTQTILRTWGVYSRPPMPIYAVGIAQMPSINTPTIRRLLRVDAGLSLVNSLQTLRIRRLLRDI